MVWAFSSADVDLALLGGHTVIQRVDVLHAGMPVYHLAAISGGVSMDASRPVQSNLTCSVIDPTQSLTTGDVDDLLNAYQCEIAPWRGVRVSTLALEQILTGNAGFGLQPFGTSGFGGVEASTIYTRLDADELAPLGVFRLTGRTVTEGASGLQINLEGQDRSADYQTPMDSALAIPALTPVEDAIVRLLSRVNPTLNLMSMRTGHVCGPLIYPPDADVWREAQLLATSVGGRLYHDRTGQCVFAPAGPAMTDPVFAYREGEGLLVSVSRTEDSDTIRNVVVAETPSGSIRVTVADEDPGSPTYVRGDYPRKVRALPNQHYQSIAQATQAASARLAYELGRSEQATITAVPHPGLDVNDLVLVHRPAVGLVGRTMHIATLDIPLAADQLMTIGTRRTVAAPNGAVLEVITEENVAA